MIEFLLEASFIIKKEVKMEGTSLFSLPEGMQVSQIQITDNGIVVEVIATAPTSCCPLCSEPSSSIHCHYRRVLRDVPCVGRRVQLFLTVRKFSCRNLLCQRKVFAERIPTFVEPWARMTIRYCQQITSIGLATCGKGGARLAARLGIQTTRQTILRRVMDLPDSLSGSLLFLGIDDFSFRRGFRFGTILVNLESRRVVDLLPDREADSSAAWMLAHPDLMAVSRDRGGAYASAARVGAPQAIQYADRFHVLKNLRESLEGLLARHLANQCKQQTHTMLDEQASVWQPKRATRSSPTLERLQQSRREERLAHYEQVIALRKLGLTQAAIARQVGIGASTVQSWLERFPNASRVSRGAALIDICPTCLSVGKTATTTWRVFFENWWSKVTRVLMRVSVTTWSVCFQRGEKYTETPYRRHRLSLLHDKLPSCFYVGLKNCVPKSRKCWPNFVSFTQRSIWPMTWFSNLPRCCAPALENTSMPGLTR